MDSDLFWNRIGKFCRDKTEFTRRGQAFYPERKMIRNFILMMLVTLAGQVAAGGGPGGTGEGDAVPFENTRILNLPEPIAPFLIHETDRFLLDRIERGRAERASCWNRDFVSAEAYSTSLAPNRERLGRILGLLDARPAFDSPEVVASLESGPELAGGPGFKALRVRWPALEGVHGEGLLLLPDGGIGADVVAIADADQSPEMIAGLEPGLPPASQFARILARNGFRVIIPVLVSREIHPYGLKTGFRDTRLPHREYLWRSAWTMGRHIAGYELQKILAAADWLARDGKRPLGIAGYGEGGRLALYAAAIDTRFDAALVSGFFESFEEAWREPADRSVFGLLREFGGAEIASMVAPRSLVIEAAAFPEVEIDAESATPGRIETPAPAAVRDEFGRAAALAGVFADSLTLVESGDGKGPFGCPGALDSFAGALGRERLDYSGEPPEAIRESGYGEERMARQVAEIDAFTQEKVRLSSLARDSYFAKLDTSSLEAFKNTVEPYRDDFREKVTGDWNLGLQAPDPRSRKVCESDNWIGYEVVLDVFENVFATGFLLVPRNLDRTRRNPAIVCQHGLGGNPRVLFDNSSEAYHNLASVLADRGYVVFTPQNLTIGSMGDEFRTLQRKSWLMGRTIFAIMVPQHEQIVRWLGSLAFVDPDRIAFYGLSYGGKTAMRVPALVKGYALSICSGDFNEWIWKVARTDPPGYSFCYPWTGEYEIFEFDLGNTFNYAEMARLIFPRPFMVERGHRDGVAPDEWVAYEYAKVRRFYDELGLGEKTAIEFFDGGHEIHLQGTWEFLVKYIGVP